MVLVFCAYIGYALRYFIKDSKQPEAKKGDEEKGDKARKKRERVSEEQSKIVYLYMFFLVLAEIIAAQLSMIAFSQIGSGVSSIKGRERKCSSIVFLFYGKKQINRKG